MANGNSVQFWGREKAVEAYEFNAVPTWALFSGKDILCQYRDGDLAEGSDKLDQFIAALQEGHSDAPYQVRIYQDAGLINEKTPYNYSFRFKLFKDGEAQASRPTTQILERLGAIENRLNGDQDEEEKPKGFQGMIAGILEKPEMQNFLMAKVFGFINSMTGGGQSPPAAIAGVPGSPKEPTSSSEAYAALSDVERGNLDTAMYILMAKDPQVGTHLLKLATILKNEPNKYKMYAGML